MCGVCIVIALGVNLKCIALLMQECDWLNIFGSLKV